MIVKTWRFSAPWRESEQEQWFQEMSRKGLHLLVQVNGGSRYGSIYGYGGQTQP